MNKKVTIYEAASGNPICRATPGEITTAMCLSNNMKHLITTSDHGVIYIWKMPEPLVKALVQVKHEFKKREQISQRIPTVIQEDDDEDHDEDREGSIHLKKTPIGASNNTKETGEDEEEKDHDDKDDGDDEKRQESQEAIPDNLKIDPLKDNTIVRKQKTDITDVLGQINSVKNLVSNLEKVGMNAPNPKEKLDPVPKLDH